MADDTVKAILGLPLDKQLGFDTQRIWATGAQVFIAEDHVLLVFREQIHSQKPGEPDGELMVKNVASIVLPVSTAKEVRDVLVNTLARLEKAENAED